MMAERQSHGWELKGRITVVPIRWIFRVILLMTFVTTFQGCRHTGSPEVAPGTTNYPEENAAPRTNKSFAGYRTHTCLS